MTKKHGPQPVWIINQDATAIDVGMVRIMRTVKPVVAILIIAICPGWLAMSTKTDHADLQNGFPVTAHWMKARLVRYLMQLWKHHKQHRAIRMRHFSIGLLS